MNTYVLRKLSKADAKRLVLQNQRRLRTMRYEIERSSRPFVVQEYINFARLSIICGKRGFLVQIEN